VNCEVALFFS
jgi:hypothetical protein